MNEIGNAVKSAFYRLSKDIFGLNFDDYLDNNDRVLFGVIINQDEKRYEQLFGCIPDSLLSAINTRYFNSVAAYKVDVRETFDTLDINADLLGVRKDILNGDSKLLNAIILHELCHAVIDSRHIDKLPIKRTLTDDNQGSKLLGNVPPDDEFHDLEFCQVLSFAANKMKYIDSRYKDRKEVIDYAMKFNKFD